MEIPLGYGARGKKTNKLQLEIIRLIRLNSNWKFWSRIPAAVPQKYRRVASNDLHVLHDYQLQNDGQQEKHTKKVSALKTQLDTNKQHIF